MKGVEDLQINGEQYRNGRFQTPTSRELSAQFNFSGRVASSEGINMNKNVGGMDRMARLVFGPLLVVAGIAGYAGVLVLAFGPLPQALTSVFLLGVGAILLVTGLTQKCPLNRVLGFNTYRQSDGNDTEESTVSTPK